MARHASQNTIMGTNAKTLMYVMRKQRAVILKNPAHARKGKWAKMISRLCRILCPSVMPCQGKLNFSIENI